MSVCLSVCLSIYLSIYEAGTLAVMGGLLHLVQRGRDWAEPARPSTASVPITVLLYDGPLLCGFNLPIRG